jgi:aldehyde:ferredoxin oxidoreductase
MDRFTLSPPTMPSAVIRAVGSRLVAFAMPVSYFGYHGSYLRVDLTTREVRTVEFPSDVLRRFIGGSGLGTWLLLNETPGCPDALSHQAPLVFAFSPLVGSPLTTSAKFAVLAKSPLTGRINDSLCSSRFAIAGKKTGYDAIVIVGAAQSPCCLVIEPEDVRFEDAQRMWGKSSRAAAKAFNSQWGPQYQIVSIGTAGENLVRFATISHDGRHAGRGGLGAVMGSKKLKAVAVHGDRLVEFAHSDRLVAYSKDLSRKSFGPATAKYRELGTMGNLLAFNRLGTLPTRNFQESTFEGADQLSPETLSATHPKTRASCAACTIGCEHLYQLPSATTGNNGKANVRLEYESIFALGPLCGIADANTVLEASALCDELGIDTISAGATIAFAMECAERGLLDVPGLCFGNGPMLLESLRVIGARQEWGKLLSLGSRAASLQIGQGSERFAPHVKGMELPGYEPRALQTMALGLAVGTRGADHNRSGAYQVDFSGHVDRMNVGVEAVEPAIDVENEAAVMDSLILCKFLRGVFPDQLAAMAEMLELVTGWDVSPAELQTMGERLVTARKWYNVRQGWKPAEDTLPRRFLSTELTQGASRGARLTEPQLRDLIAAYNLARGWTSDGWIPQQQLTELDIVAADRLS